MPGRFISLKCVHIFVPFCVLQYPRAQAGCNVYVLLIDNDCYLARQSSTSLECASTLTPLPSPSQDIGARSIKDIPVFQVGSTCADATYHSNLIGCIVLRVLVWLSGFPFLFRRLSKASASSPKRGRRMWRDASVVPGFARTLQRLARFRRSQMLGILSPTASSVTVPRPSSSRSMFI